MQFGVGIRRRQLGGAEMHDRRRVPADNLVPVDPRQTLRPRDTTSIGRNSKLDWERPIATEADRSFHRIGPGRCSGG